MQLPLLFLGQTVEFNLEIVTCDHFSLLCFGVDYKRIVKMQETLRRVRVGSSREEGP